MVQRLVMQELSSYATCPSVTMVVECLRWALPVLFWSEVSCPLYVMAGFGVAGFLTS